MGSAGRRTLRYARFTLLLLAPGALTGVFPAPATGAARYPPTRSVSLARARAAIRKSSPAGTHPRIGRCTRSLQWTTCAVYERRILSEESGASYAVTLDFTESVGERAHRLIFDTREVTLSVPSALPAKTPALSPRRATRSAPRARWAGAR